MENKKITSKDIPSWFDSILSGIQKYFNDCGEIPPLINALSKNGEATVMHVGALMTQDSNRDMIREIFMAYAKKHDVCASVMVSEGWMTKRVPQEGKPNNYETYGRPSEAPDRVEIVMVMMETSNGADGKFFEIKRDKLKPYLEEIIQPGKPTAMGGRFQGFLSKPYSEN